MPTPDNHEPASHALGDSGESKSLGYEVTDASVSGIVIFLIALAVSTGIIFVVAFGVGKVLNTAIARRDGPSNKWNAPAAGQITNKNMATDPQLEQEQLAQITQSFPTPRLQTDNGDQDVTDLHAREDLLLDHYTWVDQQKGIVRIPIGRAMQLLAQRGLPVAPAAAGQTPASAPLMTADTAPTITAPLTNGFARTGYEQQALGTLEQQHARGEAPGEQAVLGANR